MNIGIPKEVKAAESRVALVPPACAELVRTGHKVFIERNAGILSGYSNEEYKSAGCVIENNIVDVYKNATLIVKVKEPQPEEYDLIQSDHVLFCYLHLAAESELEQILIKSESTAIAFEGVTDSAGALPLLQPMSVIAGKLAAQYASVLLHKNYGGRGILIDGLGTVAGASVAVLGYGSAGRAATTYLESIGAHITVIDKAKEKLTQATKLSKRITALASTPANIEQVVCDADVVIGAVLVPGARAPVIVKKEWVARMHAGAVIVDIAVDQGGCIETTRPTTYDDPTYVTAGVVHFAVKNIPAAVPRTASQALSQAILPTAIKIAAAQWKTDTDVVAGLSVENGKRL